MTEKYSPQKGSMGGIKKGEKMSQLDCSLASYKRPKLSTPNGEKKLLLHSCCAPCAGESYGSVGIFRY